MNKHTFISALAAIALGSFPLGAVPSLAATVAAQEAQAPEELTPLATDLVNSLVKQDFVRAAQNFDDSIKAQLPPEKLQASWQELTTQIGAFKKTIATDNRSIKEFFVVTIASEFERANIDIVITFNNDKKVIGLNFQPSKVASEYQPPTYAKLNSFREQEVTVGSGKWALPGTLTLPKGSGSFPVIVLVHGSGPNDRNESSGPNRPFQDLAWGLASQGIAVLRYEKRTKAHPQEFVALGENFTLREETIDDALAAVKLLRETPGIDPKKIFVLGHSLGGMAIPQIGTLDPEIAGLIVLAGNTRPLEDLIVAQSIYLVGLKGSISAAEQQQIDTLKKQAKKVKELPLSCIHPPASQLLGVPAKYWLYLLVYQPANVAREVTQSMLLLQGERDYQVTLNEDFQGWRNILTQKKNATFKSYPKLNHLFLEGEGISTPIEYQFPSHIPEVVINDIGNWVKKPKGT